MGPDLTLQELLAPCSEASFFDLYFDRTVLHCKADDLCRFDPLRRAIETDRLVEYGNNAWGWVSLAKADGSLEACPYLQSPPSAASLGAAFADGYTIVVNNLQDGIESVGWLCRKLEACFCCRANVNLYWSPSGHQALAAHYDDDDVMVLQIEGTKHWTSYAHRDRFPTGRSDYELGELGAGVRHLLEPGDLLYLPRGTPHEAVSTDHASMHLTISLNLVRWSEVIAELVAEMGEHDIACRRAVPPAMLRMAHADLVTMAHSQLAKALGGAPPSAGIARSTHRRILSNAARINRDGADALDLSRFRTAPDQICAMSLAGDTVWVEAIGASCQFHPRWTRLCEWLVGHEPFAANQLTAMGPEDEIAEILAGLLEAGVIEHCAAIPASDAGEHPPASQFQPFDSHEGYAHA